MDNQIQPLPVGRFLDLLNKSPRTEAEEGELQQELLRQAAEKQKAAETVTASTAQIEEPKVEVVTEQPAPVAETVAVAQPAYSLEQLVQETKTAVNYLRTLDQNINLEMAISAYVQAIYWLELAGK